MHSYALHGRADMLTQKAARPAELLHFSVDIDMPVRHLSSALRGKDKHCTNAAVDVDQMVTLNSPGVERQIVKRLFMSAQIAGQPLQHARAVVKCHGPQARPAFVAGVIQHRLHVRRVVARPCDQIAGNGAGNITRAETGCDPFTCGKAGNLLDAHVFLPGLSRPSNVWIACWLYY